MRDSPIEMTREAISRLAAGAGEVRVLGPHTDTLAIDIELRRVVIAHDNGWCDDHVLFRFRNRFSETKQIPGWTITWTDADAVEVLRVSDGLAGKPAFHEVVDNVTNALEVQVEPRWALEAGKTFSILVSVRRGPALERLDGGTWIFKDPLLATSTRYPAEVLLQFPEDGTVEAAGAAARDCRCVRWSLITGPEQRRVSAVLRTNGDGRLLAVDQELRSRVTAALLEHGVLDAVEVSRG